MVGVLINLIKEGAQKGGVFVFVSTNKMAKYVAAIVQRQGIDCGLMGGKLKQNDRDEEFNKMRDEPGRVVVTTGLLGRGVDVLTVRTVIQFDIPAIKSDYAHRVGRTARMGLEGRAILIATPAGLPLVATLRKEHKIKEIAVEPAPVVPFGDIDLEIRKHAFHSFLLYYNTVAKYLSEEYALGAAEHLFKFDKNQMKLEWYNSVLRNVAAIRPLIEKHFLSVMHKGAPPIHRPFKPSQKKGNTQ
jgi:superfamily II DNA/RNA helicase